MEDREGREQDWWKTGRVDKQGRKQKLKRGRRPEGRLRTWATADDGVRVLSSVRVVMNFKGQLLHATSMLECTAMDPVPPPTHQGQASSNSWNDIRLRWYLHNTV